MKNNKTGSMMPVVLEELVDGTRPKKLTKKIAHKPGMSGDGGNILDLSMDNKLNVNDTIVSGKKETRTLWSSTKQKQKKIESDLKIVEELSGDSDGLKFNKNVKVPKMELSLKTSIDSSKDDLDSNLDCCRVLVMKNGSEQKKVETITNKLKNVQKRENPRVMRSEYSKKRKTIKTWWKLWPILQRVSLENQFKFLMIKSKRMNRHCVA